MMKISNFKSLGKVSLEKHFDIIQEDKKELGLFNLKINKKFYLKGGESNGVYAIFFKNKLTYIGLHFGKGNVVDRWEKHVKSLTCRFLPLNFLSAEREGKSLKKFNNNFTFNKLIDQFNKESNSEKKNKIKVDISEHIEQKKEQLKDKYKVYETHDNYADIFNYLKKINANSKKKVIQLLTGEGSNTTKNRLEFCLERWSDFKKSKPDDILSSFQAVYFKYFGKKNFSKKEFRNSFEEQLIKEFKPPTNKEFNKYKDKPSFYVTENEILDTLNSLN
jgi:hypothetical protein